MNELILPHDETIFMKILDVVNGRGGLEFEHEPAHMGPEEALGNVVRIVVGVDVLVVLAVFGTPPDGGILKGGGPEE